MAKITVPFGAKSAEFWQHLAEGDYKFAYRRNYSPVGTTESILFDIDCSESVAVELALKYA